MQIQYRISNYVLRGDLNLDKNKQINLEKLADLLEQKHAEEIKTKKIILRRGWENEVPNRIHALIFKIARPSTNKKKYSSILIFKTGKIVLTGSADYHDTKQIANDIADLILTSCLIRLKSD